MADHSEHVVSVGLYWLIWAVLIGATFLTAWIATVDLGIFNTVVALLIATCKASIVVLFFMHVKYSPRLTWIVVIGGFFWLAILLALTLGDYLTRGWRTYG